MKLMVSASLNILGNPLGVTNEVFHELGIMLLGGDSIPGDFRLSRQGADDKIIVSAIKSYNADDHL